MGVPFEALIPYGIVVVVRSPPPTVGRRIDHEKALEFELLKAIGRLLA